MVNVLALVCLFCELTVELSGIVYYRWDYTDPEDAYFPTEFKGCNELYNKTEFLCAAYSQYEKTHRCFTNTTNSYRQEVFACIHCPMECSICLTAYSKATVGMRFNYNSRCAIVNVYTFETYNWTEVNSAKEKPEIPRKCIKRNLCENKCNAGTCIDILYDYICICPNKAYGRNCESSGEELYVTHGVQMWEPNYPSASRFHPIMVTVAKHADRDDLTIQVSNRIRYYTVFENTDKNTYCSKDVTKCGCPSDDACQAVFTGTMLAEIYAYHYCIRFLCILINNSVSIGFYNLLELLVFNSKHTPSLVLNITSQRLVNTRFKEIQDSESVQKDLMIDWAHCQLDDTSCSLDWASPTKVPATTPISVKMGRKEIFGGYQLLRKSATVPFKPTSEDFKKSTFRFNYYFHSKQHWNKIHEQVLETYTSSTDCVYLKYPYDCKMKDGALVPDKYRVMLKLEKDTSQGMDTYTQINYDWCFIESVGWYQVELAGEDEVEIDESQQITLIAEEADPPSKVVKYIWKCEVKGDKNEWTLYKTFDFTGDELKIMAGDLKGGNTYNCSVAVTGGKYEKKPPSDSKIIIVKVKNQSTTPMPTTTPTTTTTTKTKTSTETMTTEVTTELTTLPKVTPEPKPDQELVIKCLNEDCKGIVPPNDPINLGVHTIDETPIKGNITWIVVDENDNEIPLAEILIDQRTPGEISIDPQKIEDNKPYKVVVLVDDEVKATKIINIEKDKPPSKGTCKLTPTEGDRGLTKFDIECIGWFDTRGVLLYEFFDAESEDIEHYAGRMIGSSYTGRLFQFMLTRGNIIVYIINMNGLSNKQLVKVTLNTKEIVDTYVISMYKEIVDKDLQSSQTDRMFQVASVLSEIVPTEQTEVKGNYLKGLIKLLSEKIVLDTSEDMKLAMSSMKIMLKELTSKGKYKLDDVTQKGVASLLKSVAQILRKIISDKYYRPRLRYEHVHQITRNFMDCVDMTLMATDKEITLSPEHDVDEDQIRNLYLASSDLTKAAELVMYCVSVMQKPSDNYANISSAEDISNIWTIIDNSAAIEETTANNLDKTSVKINSELANSFRYQTDFLLQYTTFKKNIFWWAEGHINTELILIGFAQLSFKHKYVFLKRLKKPINILLKVQNIEKTIIQGQVTQLDPSLNNKELDTQLRVYRIIAPPLSKVHIKFKFNGNQQKLRVLVLVNRRVDWNLISKSSVLVSEENYEYDVPYDTTDRENFYYMGILPDEEVPTGSTVDYQFELYYMLCQIWMSQWINQFCLVGNKTTESILECQCSHLSIFAGAIAVPPNDINPIQDAKLVLHIIENPLVTFCVLFLLFLFFLAFLWAAFRDIKDRQCREVIVLEDNFPGDGHGYLVAVHTGSRLTAGTTANVGIRIYGDYFASRSHILRSPSRKVLQTNNDDWFLLCYPVSLGTLNQIQLWHDNSGRSPDWFCSKIVIYDLEAKNQYIFFIEQWLALETNEYPEAVVLPATVDEILSVKRIFLDNSNFGFRESHTWLSVFVRHPRSATNRKERLTVLMVCIMTAMLASIMFFNLSDETVPGMDEATFTLREREIIVSIEAFIVSATCTVFVLFLFRKSYQPKTEVHKSLLYTPTRRQSDDPSEFWFHEKKSFYDLNDMKAFGSKKSGYEKHKSFKESIVNTLKRMVMAKKLQPVHLHKELHGYKINRIWQITAWVVSFIIILLCAYLVSLYSLKYGPVKSQKWAATLLLTFMQDIFLLTPVKIVLIAVLMSLAFQRIVDVGGFHLNVKDAVRKELEGDQNYLNELIAHRQKPMYFPIPDELKLKLREKHLNTMRWRTLLDLVLVVIFIIILCQVISGLWSGYSFSLGPNDHVRTMLTTPRRPTDTGFQQIFNRSDFLEYLDTTFISALYIYRWFDSLKHPPLNPKDDSFRRMDWCADYSTRLIGVPRLRQLRVQPGGCVVSPLFKPYAMECVLPWSEATSDQDVYGVGWHQANWADRQRYVDFWRYTRHWNSSVFESFGKTGTIYPSGGYIVNLAASRMDSRRILRTMSDLKWQDEYTRVTFAELTLYNVNDDLFTQVTMVSEHLPYGLFVTISHVESVHIFQKFSIWIVIYVVFVIILLIRIMYKMNRNGFAKFMKKFINVYEVTVIVMGVLSLVMYLIHLQQSSFYAHKFMKHGKDKFFDFDKIIGYFVITKICCVLLFCLVVFRTFVSWHFGRSYYTYYFTFTLSLEWIFNITVFVCLTILIIWRLIGYLINVYLFSNYKIVLVHHESSKFIKKESMSMRYAIIIYIIFLTSLMIKGVCFVLFSYYYKVAKNYNSHPLHYFNFINFISQKVMRRFRKVSEEKRQVKVV